MGLNREKWLLSKVCTFDTYLFPYFLGLHFRSLIHMCKDRVYPLLNYTRQY
jgi:hypothetical protein